MSEASNILTGKEGSFQIFTEGATYRDEEVSEVLFSYNKERSCNVIGVLRKPEGLVSYKISVYIKGTDRYGHPTLRVFTREAMDPKDMALLPTYKDTIR